MKPGEWKKAVRAALSTDGGADRWSFSRSLAYHPDRTWMLTGVLAEPSGVGLGEYLWLVRMPLFVPADVLDLSFSTRLLDRSEAEITEGPSPNSIRTALHAVPDDHTALTHVATTADPNNLLSLEAAAYAAVILGHPTAGAVAMLDQACAVPPAYPWMKEAITRATTIRTLLTTDKTTEALQHLHTWTTETTTTLKVHLTTTP